MSNLKAPEQILSSADTPPFALPPAADVFARRAERFDSLASGHPMENWMRFLADLSRAQHDAFQQITVTAPLSGPVPLDVDTLPLPPEWRDVLDQILTAMAPEAPPGTRLIIAGLRSTGAEGLDALAGAVLSGAGLPDDIGAQPLVSAALQVVWSSLAARQAMSSLPPHHEDRSLCPCCGTPAVSAEVRIGGSLAGLRYLHCPLCNTQWNTMRARCTSCESVGEVAQHRVEEQTGKPWLSVAAESCDACGSYRKVFYQDKDPHADAIADDLASLALDVLMAEADYARSGRNPFLVA